MEIYEIVSKPDFKLLIKEGLLRIGEGTIIDDDVYIGHWFRNKEMGSVRIGKNCKIRSGTVIYGNVEIGDGVNIGQHAVIRENCKIGDYSSIGTGVKVENNTIIGKHTSIETQSHITAYAEIGDYVFWGAMVISNNDFKMNYKRAGHGTQLKGCKCGKGVRIGSGAMLMAGVEIGDHAIINAGEIVRKNVPAETLFFTQQGKPRYKKIKVDLIENV